MNKQKEGKYMLSFEWMGKRHKEWYRDKSRAESRKNELKNYRDIDDGTFPFTNFKLEFVPEDEIPSKRFL